MNKVALYLVFGAATLLAALGLVFCWACPSSCNAYPGAPQLIFGRMVVGNLVGLLLCGLAVVVGWRGWLKAAPFVCLAWLGLAHYSFSLWPFEDRLGWIDFGPVRLNVWETAPLMISFAAAWASSQWRLRSHSAFCAIAGVAIGFVVGGFVANDYQTRQLTVMSGRSPSSPITEIFTPAECDVAHQGAAMIRSAKWFGATGVEQKALFCAPTVSMPAEASVLFGKWYLVLLLVTIGVLGAGFAMTWRGVAEGPKRSFVLVLGISITGLSVMNCLGCLLVVPLLTVGIPWASFGESMAAASWLALGILVSLVMDKERCPCELCADSESGKRPSEPTTHAGTGN